LIDIPQFPLISIDTTQYDEQLLDEGHAACILQSASSRDIMVKKNCAFKNVDTMYLDTRKFVFNNQNALQQRDRCQMPPLPTPVPSDDHQSLFSRQERAMVEEILFSDGFDAALLIGVSNADEMNRNQLLDAFETLMKKIPQTEDDKKKNNNMFNVLSNDFNPKQALNASMISNGVVRLPVLSKPWTKLSRWRQKVTGYCKE
jgi:hypothetical protein